MSLKTLFLPEAQHELWEVSHTYFGIRTQLGERFLHAFNRALWSIEEFPTAWSRILARSRRIRVGKFPYHIYYKVKKDHVVVWAVFHCHRELKPLKKLERKV